MLGPSSYAFGPGTCARARMTISMSMLTVTHDTATEIATESEAESEAATEIEVTGEREPMMESGPILPLMEPAGARWTGHGHTRQPVGTKFFVRECRHGHFFMPSTTEHCHTPIVRSHMAETVHVSRPGLLPMSGWFSNTIGSLGLKIFIWFSGRHPC